MTIIEKKSERKKKAIISLVKSGEMSIAFALSETERLNDEGRLLDNDYEEIAEYLERLLELEEISEEEIQEELTIEENVESEAE